MVDDAHQDVCVCVFNADAKGRGNFEKLEIVGLPSNGHQVSLRIIKESLLL